MAQPGNVYGRWRQLAADGHHGRLRPSLGWYHRWTPGDPTDPTRKLLDPDSADIDTQCSLIHEQSDCSVKVKVLSLLLLPGVAPELLQASARDANFLPFKHAGVILREVDPSTSVCLRYVCVSNVSIHWLLLEVELREDFDRFVFKKLPFSWGYMLNYSSHVIFCYIHNVMNHMRV